MSKLTTKTYRCTRCGHETQQATNHYGPTWSFNRTNTCPACPPWAKFPEFGENTRWLCVDTDPALQQAIEDCCEAQDRIGEDALEEYAKQQERDRRRTVCMKISDLLDRARDEASAHYQQLMFGGFGPVPADALGVDDTHEWWGSEDAQALIEELAELLDTTEN